ncbi:Dicer-like protein 1 [Podila verticillata]|nr:Dicer-like protein 1 [Podila verticillata]
MASQSLISLDDECSPPSAKVSPSRSSAQLGSLLDTPCILLPFTPAPSSRTTAERVPEPVIKSLSAGMFSPILQSAPARVRTTLAPNTTCSMTVSSVSHLPLSPVSPKSTAGLLNSPVPDTLPKPLISQPPVFSPVFSTPLCNSPPEAPAVDSVPSPVATASSSHALITSREASSSSASVIKLQSTSKDPPEEPLGPPLIPRQYQLDMYEKALLENVIAVMDTGSGKTLVAAMLIKEMIRREEDNHKSPSEKKLPFFVVANIPLVRQQADAIRRYCGATVAEISGAGHHGKLPTAVWHRLADEFQVVVVTAQILLDALRQGYWNMTRINVLVFDECHHARKTHPYCLIMNEFYHNTPQNLKKGLPRIFGMTASLTTETGLKLDHSARELQRLMDCQVYTVSSESLQGHVERPQQIVMMHNPPPKYNPTQLTHLLREFCRFEAGLLSIMNNTPTLLSQLGPWCVDQIWRLAVEHTNPTDSQKVSVGASELLAKAKTDVSAWAFPVPALADEHLTPKVQKLIQILRVTARLFKDEFCGIIFVQRRDTAAALTLLLQEYEPFREIFRVQVLAGHTDNKDPVLRMSFKDQSTVINKFRDGEYNLLVSTCVAEEGLDIQPCNIVICFDPVATTTSYVQSRGRARKTNSRYFMLQERHPDERVRNLEDTSLMRLHRGEQIMRDWCSKQDLGSLRNNAHVHESTPAGVSHLERFYRVPSTQALLTLDAAIPLLNQFCIKFAQDEYSEWKPVYDVFPSGSSWSCILTLPPNAGIREVQSDRTPTKDMARMHAAFKACEVLHKAGALDDHLEPFSKNVLTEDDSEATTPIFKPDQTNPYPHNLPSFWNDGLPKKPVGFRKVFLCTVALKDTSAYALRYQPMYLITAKRLPFSKHSFNVYVRGEVHNMTLAVSEEPLVLSSKRLDLLRHYTLVLLKRITGKKVECLDDMPFMLAPISDADLFDPVIDWREVQMGQSLEAKPMASNVQTEEALKELVVVVKKEHPCDYFILNVVKHTLDDIIPAARFKKEVDEWVASHEGTTQGPTFKQFFEWKLKVACNNDKDTILQVQQIYHFRNHLQPELSMPHQKAPTLAPLSACLQSTVSAHVLRIAQLVPSVICDLDELLLVQEVRQKLRLQTSIKLDILQEALTTSSLNRDYNYERLELLGDVFLKFSSTIRLYIVNATMAEGELHQQRTKIISNAALREHALRLELFRYVANCKFQRTSWTPVKMVMDGKSRDEQQQHLLSNKTLSDFVESTMGAALVSKGVEAAFVCAKALGIPFSEFHVWADFKRVHSKLTQDSGGDDYRIAKSEAFKDRLHGLESLLRYTFEHPSLAQEAMTHHSAATHQDACDYQRLEFLGDAVLDYLIVWHYYQKYPDAPPGAITLIKDASVNNQILGAMAVAWGLSGFLIHMSEPLAGEIQRVIATIEAIKENSDKGQLEAEYWVDLKMPKVLSDIVESMLGAVFVDCGFNVARVTQVFEHLVWPFLEKHVNLDNIVIHPMKALTEYLQMVQGCSDSRMEQVGETREGEEGGETGKGEEESREPVVKPSMLRRLGLGREGHRDLPALTYRFVVHGNVVASRGGEQREEERKQVAMEALWRLKTEPGLLETLCSCPKRKKQGRGTMLDKYRQAHSMVSQMD